jgi:hypothetical protein
VCGVCDVIVEGEVKGEVEEVVKGGVAEAEEDEEECEVRLCLGLVKLEEKKEEEGAAAGVGRGICSQDQSAL